MSSEDFKRARDLMDVSCSNLTRFILEKGKHLVSENKHRARYVNKHVWHQWYPDYPKFDFGHGLTWERCKPQLEKNLPKNFHLHRLESLVSRGSRIDQICFEVDSKKEEVHVTLSHDS